VTPSVLCVHTEFDTRQPERKDPGTVFICFGTVERGRASCGVFSECRIKSFKCFPVKSVPTCPMNQSFALDTANKQ